MTDTATHTSACTVNTVRALLRSDTPNPNRKGHIMTATATPTPTDEQRIRARFGETIEREWLVPDSTIRMAIVRVMDGQWGGATYTPLWRWIVRIRLVDQRLVTIAQRFDDIDAASSIASQARQAAHDSDGVDFIEDNRPGRHVYSGR